MYTHIYLYIRTVRNTRRIRGYRDKLIWTHEDLETALTILTFQGIVGEYITRRVLDNLLLSFYTVRLVSKLRGNFCRFKIYHCVRFTLGRARNSSFIVLHSHDEKISIVR